MCVCVHVCLHECVYVYVNLCVHICVYMNLCMHEFVYACVLTYMEFLIMLVFSCCGQKSDQEAGKPQGGFTFKKFFKFGTEQPIDERLATLDSEMSTLDEVCKEKRKKLK